MNSNRYYLLYSVLQYILCMVYQVSLKIGVLHIIYCAILSLKIQKQKAFQTMNHLKSFILIVISLR